jgi:hypothetical protein
MTEGFPGIKNPPGVSLDNRFEGPVQMALKATGQYCAPTDVLGSRPDAPSQPEHLLGYKVSKKGKSLLPQNIKVANDLNPGGLHLVLTKASHILVSSVSDPDVTPPLPESFQTDHFECYGAKVAKGAAKFHPVPGVTLRDEFGSLTVVVTKPKFLCTPVNLNGQTPDAADHPQQEMCYEAKLMGTPFARMYGIHTNNEFGPETDDVSKPITLCVPSTINP